MEGKGSKRVWKDSETEEKGTRRHPPPHNEILDSPLNKLVVTITQHLWETNTKIV